MRPSPGLVLFAICLLFLGDCRLPPPKVQSEPEHVAPPAGVSALSLVQTPDAYKGRRVRVMLPARTYRTNSAGIVWADGNPRRPSLLIECNPPAGAPSLDIIGTCRGRVGESVVLSECSVSAIANHWAFSRGAWALP
jgi:hypothetical protein